MEDVLQYTQEFAILNTLNHKNIIKLHEVSCTPLTLFSINTDNIYIHNTNIEWKQYKSLFLLRICPQSLL